jgi:hypothetical protein
MEYGKTDYKARFAGQTITLSWEEFYEDFFRQWKAEYHEDWLPLTAAARTVELAATVYADSMMEWYYQVHTEMEREAGYEYEEVQTVLKKAGLLRGDW